MKMVPMNSDTLLSQLSEFICERFGLHYPRKRWRELERKMLSLAEDFGFRDAASCVRWIVSSELDRSELDTIACRLTIGETYFFREKKSFDALEAHILPEIISSRSGKDQRLRIWSAGCSTGEEAYSIAILLSRLIPDLSRWNITILATDVNPVFIRKASRGEYGEWSFRGVPRWLKDKYFTKNGEVRYQLADAIRKMVTFARLNLAEDPYPSLLNNTNAMDIIFCRNVLMYFSQEGMKKTIGNFHHSLLDGGWLVVSPCEASHALFPGFKAVNFNDAVFYRKGRQAQPEPSPIPSVVAEFKVIPKNVLDSGSPFSGEADPVGESGTCPGKFSLNQVNQKSGGASGSNGGIHPYSAVQPPSSAIFPGATPERDHSSMRVSPHEEALSLYCKGEYGGAAAILVELLANRLPGSDPDCHGEAEILLARALANQGKFAEALEWLEMAIASDRLDPQPYYLQATIFMEQGFDDAAAIALKKALYVDHGFVLAHFALASLAMRNGRREEAVRQLDNAAAFLRDYGDDDLLAGSDGLSARRFAEIIAVTRESIAGRTSS